MARLMPPSRHNREVARLPVPGRSSAMGLRFVLDHGQQLAKWVIGTASLLGWHSGLRPDLQYYCAGDTH